MNKSNVGICLLFRRSFAHYSRSNSSLLLGTCTLLRKQHSLDVRQNAPLRDGNAREELVELFVIPVQSCISISIGSSTTAPDR